MHRCKFLPFCDDDSCGGGADDNSHAGDHDDVWSGWMGLSSFRVSVFLLMLQLHFDCG